MAFLDGSVVNVALPAISRDLGGGLAVQQWVVNAYLITLGSLILVAGSFSDVFGRKKVLTVGLIGFAATSLLCAIAPSGLFLIISRALQGISGALLVPSSLALIISSFSGSAQGKAIGSWTAWTGISFIIGPLVGGFLVDAASWRYIFAINVVPIAITLWLLRLLGQIEDSRENTRIDIAGTILCVIGLGASVYALIEQPHYGCTSVHILIPLIIGLSALAYFVWHEHHASQPMLPLSLFRIRNFSAGNIATVAIYGGLSMATFLISVFVQQTGGYSAIEAGLALLPVTILMFFLSGRFGALAGRYGPRFFMTVGPIVAGLAFLIMRRIDDSVLYWSQLFPGILLFGIGLAMTVAPLTTAVLGAIAGGQAGIASATNNAVARIAGLLAIAALGVITGAHIDLDGFRRGLLATAVLLFVGGLVSAIGIRNSRQQSKN